MAPTQRQQQYTNTVCPSPSLALSLMPCSWAATSASLSRMPVSACVHADHESASAYALTGMPSLPLLLPDDGGDAPMLSLTLALSLTTVLTQR